MKHLCTLEFFIRHVLCFLRKRTICFLSAMLFFGSIANAQSQISQYVLFGSTSVVLASGSSVQGGKVGSSALISTTGSATFTGDLNSGGKVTFGNNNTVIN